MEQLSGAFSLICACNAMKTMPVYNVHIAFVNQMINVTDNLTFDDSKI